LEKTLKAIISYKGEEVPFLHDLNRLAKKAGLELPKDFIEDFDEITTFNLQARYDDYRYNFYKKATPSFSEKWGKKCDFYYKWLIKRK